MCPSGPTVLHVKMEARTVFGRTSGWNMTVAQTLCDFNLLLIVDDKAYSQILLHGKSSNSERLEVYQIKMSQTLDVTVASLKPNEP